MTARFIIGDAREVLRSLPAGSADLVLTSPPFLALRSYLPNEHPAKAREIGGEASPGAFLDALLDIVDECGRILAPHGSLVIELGDTFASNGGTSGGSARLGLGDDGGSQRVRCSTGPGWPLDKSLCMIPSSLAWALAYGRNPWTGRTLDPWRVRNLIAWCRPNPPVGALGDKFRPATSYLTVACKARDRWFDLEAVRTGFARDYSAERPTKPNREFDRRAGGSSRTNVPRETVTATTGAPPLDWWEIATQPYDGAHYAAWPERLIVRPIEAMCPREVCLTCGEPRRRLTERSERYAAAREAIGDFNARSDGDGLSGSRTVLSAAAGADMTCAENITVGWTDCGHDSYRRGVVLDPFGGSGTTAAVAEGCGRDSLLVDLDERNAVLAGERVGMFLTVETYAEAVA